MPRRVGDAGGVCITCQFDNLIAISKEDGGYMQDMSGRRLVVEIYSYKNGVKG